MLNCLIYFSALKGRQIIAQALCPTTGGTPWVKYCVYKFAPNYIVVKVDTVLWGNSESGFLKVNLNKSS